jgi:hypothetical protein
MRTLIVTEFITVDGVVEALLGSGLRLFAGDNPEKTELAPADVTTFPTGVTVLTYHRAA